MAKRLLIAYFMDNISTKTYQNPFMCVKVIASLWCDVFETWCTCKVAYTYNSDRKGCYQRVP